MTGGVVKEQLVWLLIFSKPLAGHFYEPEFSFPVSASLGLQCTFSIILNSVYDCNDTYFSFKFRMLKR